jgi:transcriptional regulator with XRE-family HTH domain
MPLMPKFKDQVRRGTERRVVRHDAMAETFSRRMAELVERSLQAGMSVRDLAFELGVTPPTIMAYCAIPPRLPPLATIVDLAQKAGVTVDWLTGCEAEASLPRDLVTVEQNSSRGQRGATQEPQDVGPGI